MGKRSLELARKIQKAFVEKYLDKVSHVQLTRHNIADHLLSIVSFQEGPTAAGEAEVDKELEKSQTSVGIVTNFMLSKRSTKPQ